MKLVLRAALVTAALGAPGTFVTAQERPDAGAGARVQRITVDPAELVLEVGRAAPFTVKALDAEGNEVNAMLRFAAPFRALRVDQEARTITAAQPGDYELVVSVVLPPGTQGNPAEARVPVRVSWPAVARVDVSAEPGRLYVGTVLGHSAAAFHADGSERPDPVFRWNSSDPNVATVDRFGHVTAHAPGNVTITASFEGAAGEVRYSVAPFPATSLELGVSVDRARTGDVIALTGRALAANGNAIADVPITYSYTFMPDDSIAAPGAAGLIVGDRFVAEVPGVYTLIAAAGPFAARKVVDVRPREVVRPIEFVGQGTVHNYHTSDLWIFEGMDGRDYAVTGTWGADGYAYFWDVTDPANIVKTDSIKVDARTVNDVKVSPDGRYAALGREGASNRRNGVVILDLKDPAHPVIASVYDEGLTGGVHNMFATEDYLFALSAGDKYVILDVRDLANPKFVSEYNHPDSRIHDVWVHDGIAYSSEWGTGVVVVDVGNGKWGGTIENPKFVTAVPYPVGATHAAFPYYQESTGKFYLFLGDEIMSRRGAAWAGNSYSLNERGGVPQTMSGYIHIIDFTDPENPKDVARYEVPEFGTHNIWVEDDVLYQGYYDGGMRVVDVSGELLGNLANQGREIAVFKPFDPQGYTPNAPMVWGAQPYKGHVFFSDFNSGLWAAKLQPPRREAT